MKLVLVKSVHGAFGYVMEHYYPFGMADEAAAQGALTDTCVVISIQDSYTGGFGIRFEENHFCKGVLTFYEQKTFWSLGKYMLRSRKGIEKLINLISIVYSMMIVLPCVSEDFSFLKRLILIFHLDIDKLTKV